MPRPRQKFSPDHWTPAVSLSYCELAITLNSHYSQELVDNYYECSMLLVQMLTALPRFCDKEQAEEVESVVRGKVNAVHEAIQAEDERQRKIAADNGVDLDQVDVGFTKAKTFQLRRYTPVCHQLAQVLELYDQLMWIMEVNFLHDLIHARARKDLAYQYRKVIQKLTRELKDLHVRTRDATHRAHEERRTQKAKPSADASSAVAGAKPAGEAAPAVEKPAPVEATASTEKPAPVKKAAEKPAPRLAAVGAG